MKDGLGSPRHLGIVGLRLVGKRTTHNVFLLLKLFFIVLGGGLWASSRLQACGRSTDGRVERARKLREHSPHTNLATNVTRDHQHCLAFLPVANARLVQFRLPLKTVSLYAALGLLTAS